MADTDSEVHPNAADWAAATDILHKANAGDRAALERLRRFLDENPAVWQRLGDLARAGERAWIELIAGGDALSAESVRRQLDDLKRGLTGDEPSVVEGLMADTILGTWLEIRYLAASGAELNRTPTQASVLTKRLESAQKRHLTALKQLMQIRKLIPNRDAIPQLRVFPERETA